MEIEEWIADVGDYPTTYTVTSGNIEITWNPPDDSPGGVREPRSPRPGSPAIPASAEPAYTGG